MSTSISNEHCPTEGRRNLASSEHPEGEASKQHRCLAASPAPQGRPGGVTGRVASGAAVGQSPNPVGVDLSSLAAVLGRACGCSVIGAVVGRSRLHGELVRHLGCSAPMAEMLLGAMIQRGLIRQEVHRAGWVHWVVTRTDGVA